MQICAVAAAALHCLKALVAQSCLQQKQDTHTNSFFSFHSGCKYINSSCFSGGFLKTAPYLEKTNIFVLETYFKAKSLNMKTFSPPFLFIPLKKKPLTKCSHTLICLWILFWLSEKTKLWTQTDLWDVSWGDVDGGDGPIWGHHGNLSRTCNRERGGRKTHSVKQAAHKLSLTSVNQQYTLGHTNTHKSRLTT